MERIPVESSNIADIGYDGTILTLEVGFKSGSVYQFFDVPETVYQELMSAPSIGGYFNANVRNNYRYTQL